MPTRESQPDGPSVLHAPWRMSYMELLKAQAAAKDADAKPSVKASCFLRDYWLNPQSDEKNNVIVRTGTEDAPGGGRGGLIMLNRYPYANGHLIVCLGHSRMRLLDYTPEQRAELWSLVDLAVELCERALEPQGVNIGINQGDAAGAGVPEHLHAHVVPRWRGDVNFITAVGQVRVLPSSLEDMDRRYREVWEMIRSRA
ncbi:MAG: HIT domain-containing protein [Planctomycetota bacterium]